MEEDKSNDNQNPNDQLTECQQKADEYLNNWKRERADFLNYKKDEVKRLEEFVKFANEAVILEVIDVLDDLERASKEVKNEGLDQVLKKFQDLLKKYGIEKIGAEGDFNPLLHEAVAVPPEALGEGREGTDGDKLEEVRTGYTMHGRVIRPTRVKIIK